MPTSFESIRGDWLVRMPLDWESGPGDSYRPPCRRSGLFPAAALQSSLRWPFLSALPCGGCLLVWHQRIWFAWLIPAGIQIPFGLTWCLTSQYLLESRRRKELRSAFGFYLSPEMADLIANSDFDLHPGGKVVEATVIFTDLENFTTLSRNLILPKYQTS